jgi:hypothetical protein
MDNIAVLRKLADALNNSAWRRLQRKPAYENKTGQTRARRDNPAQRSQNETSGAPAIDGRQCCPVNGPLGHWATYYARCAPGAAPSALAIRPPAETWPPAET